MSIAEQLEAIEVLVRSHKIAFDEGRWKPAHDEVLCTVILREQSDFPTDDIPPQEEFIVECAKHQACAVPSLVAPDLSACSPEEKLAAYRAAARRLQEPRGHDRCWEHYAVFYATILPELNGKPPVPSSCLERMQLCLLYRAGLETALGKGE